MALKAVHKEVTFGVGDTIRVTQTVFEGNKKRSQVFEGMVISIRGDADNRSFVVRRIGTQQIGIEKIFPLAAPIIEKIEVVRNGTEGVRHAKLYFTRDIPKRDVEKIYRRKSKHDKAVSNKPKAKSAPKKVAKKTVKKSASKKK